MKRSQTIALALLGGMSAGAAITGCSPAAASRPVQVTPESFYENDYYLPGAGYYHAPFHAFYPLPYNYYSSDTASYFYGGQWGKLPFASAINISAPTQAAAKAAEAARTDIIRGGFGGTAASGSSGYHYYVGS